MQERALFHLSLWSTQAVFRIAISCNFGKKGILFSSTSCFCHLGYEFQRHKIHFIRHHSAGFCDIFILFLINEKVNNGT